MLRRAQPGRRKDLQIVAATAVEKGPARNVCAPSATFSH
jgi:hypothetical protein